MERWMGERRVMLVMVRVRQRTEGLCCSKSLICSLGDHGVCWAAAGGGLWGAKEIWGLGLRLGHLESALAATNSLLETLMQITICQRCVTAGLKFRLENHHKSNVCIFKCYHLQINWTTAGGYMPPWQCEYSSGVGFNGNVIGRILMSWNGLWNLDYTAALMFMSEVVLAFYFQNQARSVSWYL